MIPYVDDGDVRLYLGHVLEVLAAFPEGSVDCIVTSPPYFGLRDYGIAGSEWPDGWVGQLGLEPSPSLFIEHLVDVFAALRRVLAPHGTCWMNMGDTYASKARGGDAGWETSRLTNPGGAQKAQAASLRSTGERHRGRDAGFKEKDLMLMPARCAIALQDDGWWLRSDVIWHKPNPMPESVTDRPTKAHEYLFLLTKAPRYYWDAEAVREPHAPESIAHQARYGSRLANGKASRPTDTNTATQAGVGCHPGGRNVRTVWTFPTEPNPEAHFATFPRELVRRCLAAGCPERVCATCGEPSTRTTSVEYVKSPVHGAGSVVGRHYETGANGYDGAGMPRLNKQVTTTGWTDCGHDAYRPGVVLDPFMGSGTTAVVARAMGIHAVGIDGSLDYLDIARRRTQQLSLLGGAA